MSEQSTPNEEPAVQTERETTTHETETTSPAPEPAESDDKS